MDFEFEIKNDKLLKKAVDFATEAHAGTFRKGTDIPYIEHPLAAFRIVCGITEDSEVRAAAVLHDTVEDTDVSREDIEREFGKRVADLVASESENKRENLPEKDTWKIRKLETLEDLKDAGKDTQIICLGDKLANMRDIARDYEALGEKLWERFNAPEDDQGLDGKKANIGWYYRSVADSLRRELGRTEAWQELDRLVVDVFGLKSELRPLPRAELVGYNRRLEAALAAAHEAGLKDNKLNNTVYATIALSMAAGDYWYVPVVTADEMGNKAVPPEKLSDAMFATIDGIPVVALTITAPDGRNLFLAYTSRDQIPDNYYFIRADSSAVIQTFAQEEALDILLINMNKEKRDILLNKEKAEQLLEDAKTLDQDDVRKNMFLRLEPLAVIDTNSILEAWKDGWAEPLVNNDWALESYPVMPDGTVLLLFGRYDSVKEARAAGDNAVHIGAHYRVLQYGLGADGPKLMNEYRFCLQNRRVKSVFVRDEKLFAIAADWDSDFHTVLQQYPETEEDSGFQIFDNVNRVQSRSDGTLLVSYVGDSKTPLKTPFLVMYDVDGEFYDTCKVANAVSILDINLDADENIWLHSYPSQYLIWLNEDERSMEKHRVELQGFDGFALSDDKTRLVTAFEGENNRCLIYVMYADEKGDYVSPFRFAFEPKDDDGKIIDPGDCECYGCPSMCKSDMILRAGDRLYWYDVNAF